MDEDWISQKTVWNCRTVERIFLRCLRFVATRRANFRKEGGNSITLIEIRTSVNKMKKGNSQDHDGLPVEVSKARRVRVSEERLRILNKAKRTETALDCQKGMISILKKREKTVCDNHRGITLLSHTGKIYTEL